MKHRTVGLLLIVFAVIAGAQEAPRQITFGDGRDIDPAVSPDGNHLAFASDRTGNYDLYQLTFGETGVKQLTQSEKDDRQPAWSPDNRKIVFWSKRTGKGDLYELDLEGGGGYLQLTDRQDYDESPSYTPTGAGILFVSAPKKAVKLKVAYNVVLADAKAKANNARVLAEGEQARFSPKGDKIVFVSDRTKNQDIWLMNTDGTMQTQLTTDSEDDVEPCFSPDGKQIVFASKRTGNFDIWVMDADGGNKRQLTTSPEDERQPVWSRGDYLYYTKEIDTTESHIFRIAAP